MYDLREASQNQLETLHRSTAALTCSTAAQEITSVKSLDQIVRIGNVIWDHGTYLVKSYLSGG